MNEQPKSSISIPQSMYEKFERAIGYGILRGFMGILFSIGAMAFVADYYSEKDSTDGDKRSGMGLHVDNETGCEYLSAPGGGLYPRQTSLGKHKGCF